MRTLLLAEHPDWSVWTDWYEARLEGRPANEALEVARATLPDEVWKQGPRAVNAAIRELIARHSSAESGEAADVAPPPELPLQGHGPHFAVEDGRLVFAPLADLDAASNNLPRLRSLLPLVRDLAADAVRVFGRNAQHARILDVLSSYAEAVGRDLGAIDFEVVAGLGIMLANADSAAGREIVDRLRSPLEDDERAALSSLLDLHGPLVLATEAGQSLLADAERYNRDPHSEAEGRRAATVIATGLVADAAMADPAPAAFLAQATAEIGRGDNPARSAVFGFAAIRNASIVLASGGVAYALGCMIASGSLPLAVVGGTGLLILNEGTKKAKVFANLSGPWTNFLDRIHDLSPNDLDRLRSGGLRRMAAFVATHEPEFRALAGTRREFRWLHDQLDWLIRHGEPPKA